MLTRSRARRFETHPTTSGSSLNSASQPPGPAPAVSPVIPEAAVASSSSDEYFSPPTTPPPARRRGRGRPPASLGPRGPPASDRVPAVGGSVQRMRWTSSINENVMRSYFGATEGGINLTAYRGRMLSLFQVLEPAVNVSVQRLSDQVRVIQRNRMLDDAVLDRLRLESQSSRVSPATPLAAAQRQPSAAPRPDHVGDADDDAAITDLETTIKKKIAKDEPASSGDSGDESGSEPESPSEKLLQVHKQEWTCDTNEREGKQRESHNEPQASTSSTTQEADSSKPCPSLPKLLPKIEMPGGAMLYHSGVLAGLDGIGSNLGLGNLAMGYPHGFILGLANQGQEGASSSNQPQFITIPLSMAMAAAAGGPSSTVTNGCGASASSDDSSELQDLSTGRK